MHGASTLTAAIAIPAQKQGLPDTVLLLASAVLYRWPMKNHALAFAGFLSLACLGCGAKPEPSRAAADPLLAKLQPCGLDVSAAAVVSAPQNERHIRLGKHPRLSRKEFDCIAQVLVDQDYGLRTDNYAFSVAYGEAWDRARRRRDATQALKWFGANRPNMGLHKYAKGSPMDAYVRSIEAACGARPGTARFVVQYKYRSIAFPNERPDDPDTDCVEAALIAGLVDEDVKISRWRGVP